VFVEWIAPLDLLLTCSSFVVPIKKLQVWTEHYRETDRGHFQTEKQEYWQ